MLHHELSTKPASRLFISFVGPERCARAVRLGDGMRDEFSLGRRSNVRCTKGDREGGRDQGRVRHELGVVDRVLALRQRGGPRGAECILSGCTEIELLRRPAGLGRSGLRHHAPGRPQGGRSRFGRRRTRAARRRRAPLGARGTRHLQPLEISIVSPSSGTSASRTAARTSRPAFRGSG